MVQRYDIDGEPYDAGVWVDYADYLALQAALREALDGWVKLYLNGGPGPNADRIAALRAQFLDDK